MISKKELLKWLDTLPAKADIAIDEGGICLIVPSIKASEVYIEVGGAPDESDEVKP